MTGAPDGGEQTGQGEPAAAADVALSWVNAVRDADDWAAAWPTMHPLYRLCLVQDWLKRDDGEDAVNAEDDDEAARWANTDHPSGRSWVLFARSAAVAASQTFWADSRREWRISLEPQPRGNDDELVLLVRDPTEFPVNLDMPSRDVAMFILMRYTPEGWLVLNIGSSREPTPD